MKDIDVRWRRSEVSTPAVPGSYLIRLRYSDEEKERSFEYQCVPSEESQHYIKTLKMFKKTIFAILSDKSNKCAHYGLF
jgi:hypothetical protein